MKRQMIRMIAAVAVLSSSSMFLSRANAVPTSYAPTGIQNLAVSNVDGQPRRVTLTFNAPSNAETATLSGYFIQFRCLSKTTKSAPCTGKWRNVAFHETEEDTTTNNELTTLTYTLPAGIAGTVGRPVSFRIIPVGDDDEMLLGPTSMAAVINIRDTPVLETSPVATSSRSKLRITVRIASDVIAQTRGSSNYDYVVQYSRNNKSWTTLTGANAPANGWAPGASKIVSVPSSGVRYYFRLRIDSNAGSTTQNPPKSQVAR